MTYNQSTIALRQGKKVTREIWAAGTYLEAADGIVILRSPGSSQQYSASPADQAATDWIYPDIKAKK